MRVKFQMRNSAGIFEEVLLDPEAGHILGLEFTAADMTYIARRAKDHKGPGRLQIGCMPQRIKTQMSAGGRGTPVDIVVDRTAGDWLAIELTPDDLSRFASSYGGDEMIRVKAFRTSARFTPQQADKFMTDWPPLSDKVPNAFPDMHNGGAPAYMRGRENEAVAYRAWSKNWPPVFHATDRAPEARLILPGIGEV